MTTVIAGQVSGASARVAAMLTVPVSRMLFTALQAEAFEEQERNKHAALQKLRSKVLDCPLCGQHLKTSSVRTMKKVSQRKSQSNDQGWVWSHISSCHSFW